MKPPGASKSIAYLWGLDFDILKASSKPLGKAETMTVSSFNVFSPFFEKRNGRGIRLVRKHALKSRESYSVNEHHHQSPNISETL